MQQIQSHLILEYFLKPYNLVLCSPQIFQENSFSASGGD